MKKVSFIAVALVAISLLAAPLALGQGGNPPASTKESGQTSGKGMTGVEQTGESVEQQIKTLSDQLAQALLKGDTSFFEKYLADDYTGIYASSQPYTKAESLKPGALKYESFDVREMKIRVYGDTAVVTSLTSAKGTIRGEGKPFSGDYRTTRVWVKQKGGWKLVAFQATQVPPASQ
jgi:ketosteroid isomerase-like protein